MASRARGSCRSEDPKRSCTPHSDRRVWGVMNGWGWIRVGVVIPKTVAELIQWRAEPYPMSTSTAV